jgi:SAM-dependent methyltransferase
VTEDRYEAVADFYESGWVDAYDDPVSLAFLELLGPLGGLRVLDIACGHGRFTRELARRGAQMTGVDLSAALVAKAREIEEREPLGICYLHADVASDPLAAGATFDVVSCSFGLSDIDDLDGALRTVSRVLRSGGRFVFSILHPCFAGGGQVSGSWPSDGTYYDEGWWLPEGRASSLRRQVGANHRMLSTYNNSLATEGLRLDALTEPPPPTEWSDQAIAASRFPTFLVARCLKG